VEFLPALRRIVSTIVIPVVIVFSSCSDTKTGESGEITVSGSVTFDNRPVAGAKIYLVIPGITFNDHHIIDTKTPTQTDGSFSFTIDSDILSPLSPPNVVIYSPNFSVSSFDILNTMDSGNIEVQLSRADSLSGILTDKTGNPIINAEISITRLNQYHHVSCVIPEMRFTTDEAGKFTVTPVPAGSIIRLEVTASGYALEHREIFPAGKTDCLCILVPEGRIEGTVTYTDTGEPAENVRVCATSPSSRPEFISEIVTTNAQGEYTIKHVPPGSFLVSIVPDDDSPSWIAENAHLRIETGETIHETDLILKKGGVITGRVTEEDTGEPIVGNRIYAYNQKAPINFLKPAIFTDKNGCYRLRCIPGEINLWTYSHRNDNYFPQNKEKDIAIIDGETIEGVDFTFKKGITVTGKVLSPDGTPAVGAIITPNRAKAENIWYGKVTTGKNGSFTLNGVREGEPLPLLVEHKGLNLINEAEIDLEKDVTIRLMKTGTDIVGRVANRDGEPLSGASVSLSLLSRNASAHSFTTVSDDQGIYRFTNVPFGYKFGISAKNPGYRERDIPHSYIEKNMLPLRDMILFKTDRWIEGTVTDWNGKPVVGAEVEVITGCCREREHTFTDTDGHYRVENLFRLVEPSVTIQHREKGHYRFNNVITNKQHDFTFIEAPNFIAGKVVDTDNNPVDARVEVYPGMHESGRFQGYKHSKPDGTFRIDNIVGDAVTVTLYGYDIYEKVQANRDDILLVRNEELRMKSNPGVWKAKKNQKYFIEGRPAPELQVSQWFNGKPVTLEDLKYKLVLLCFWTIEDEESIEALCYVNALDEVFTDELIVIGIHEYHSDINKIKTLINEKDIQFPVALDSNSNKRESLGLTFDAYRFVDFPFNLIVDTDGCIHMDGYAFDKRDGTSTESGLNNNELDVQQKIRRLISRNKTARKDNAGAVENKQTGRAEKSQQLESSHIFTPDDAVIIEEGGFMDVREAVIKLSDIYDEKGIAVLIPAVASLVNKTMKDLSAPRLNDMEENNLSHMLEFLSQSGDERAQKPLVKALCSDRNEDVRHANIDIYVEGFLGIGQSVIPEFADSLESARFIPRAILPQVLAHMAEADPMFFSESDREIFRPVLVENSQSENYQIRMYSVEALGYFGNDTTVRLLKQLHEEDPAVLPWRKSEYPVRNAAEKSLNMIMARSN